MVATAADIPIELYDLILSFFMLETDFMMPLVHVLPATWRNYVLANKRELGLLALVCYQWARLLQPQIFRFIKLRNQDDVKSLLRLLTNPECRIADYIRDVDLSHSVAAYPYPPWIDIVTVQLIPKLRRFLHIQEMTLTGPLPAGQSLRSIHSVLPRRYPQFAAGINRLMLKDLHLKSLGHLVQLLKELPSLVWVDCENVTWDSSPDAPLPAATSYVGKDTDKDAEYRMRMCTDNVAAGWLAWLLAPRLSLRLEQQDSDTLCRIASLLFTNVNAARSPHWYVKSTRREDRLIFESSGAHSIRSTPTVSVYLTSAVPGSRTPRRVRAIRLWFNKKESSVVGWDHWPAIDAQLATLTSLRTVLITTQRHDDLVLLASEVVATKTPQLRYSTKLKYVCYPYNGFLWYTHDTVDSEDKGRRMNDIHDIL